MAKYSRQAGFTLVEALVAAAIFAIAVGAIAVVFTAVIRAERKGTSQEEVMNEIRTVMEQMTREIRESKINYDCYKAPLEAGANPTLCLTKSGGQPVSYSLNNSTGQLLRTEGVSTTSLTTADVNIQYLNFFVRPLNELNTERQAPQVTFTLGIKTIAAGHKERESLINLQATVAPRDFTGTL